ncbi:MAG: hypothetical protein BWY04_00632 [candidate division CPR1 bacterium ADurb.Bin160]|uniref:Uncharacterized protein n=1 Tax=candidate division CPR1 bacterium ADurb.Bin160 TaxID=1852826 RepID=A0A1V5ZPF3_9BACT|nr:MAG: hypothetical protein BWY04_00632 [candidate division CPR1 bacterium ADurb.Bin160]
MSIDFHNNRFFKLSSVNSKPSILICFCNVFFNISLCGIVLSKLPQNHSCVADKSLSSILFIHELGLFFIHKTLVAHICVIEYHLHSLLF